MTAETGPVQETTPVQEPEAAAAEPEAPPAAPEPDFVVVPRDQVDDYASHGWQVGYAMLRPE